MAVDHKPIDAWRRCLWRTPTTRVGRFKCIRSHSKSGPPGRTSPPLPPEPSTSCVRCAIRWVRPRRVLLCGAVGV